MYGRVSDGVTLVWPGNPSLLGAIDETQDLFACWVWSKNQQDGVRRRPEQKLAETEPVLQRTRARS